MVKTLKPFHVFLLFLLVFILDTFATIYKWYWTFEWFDVVMHFLGGAFAGAAFFWLFPRFLAAFPRSLPNLLAVFILALSFVSFVGVSWEFYELIRGTQGDILDTMQDFFVDLSGGAIAALLVLFSKERSSFE